MKRQSLVFVLLLLASCIGAVSASPIADNYDFNYPDMSTTPTASDAADYQINLYDGSSYTAYASTNCGAGLAYQWMEDDALFFFNGHGIKDSSTEKGGGVCFYDGNSYSWIVASGNLNPPYYSISNSNDIDDVLLSVYLACYTAYTHPSYGNLLDESITQGVDSVIGFEDSITNSKANDWSDKFWSYTSEEGQTISNAANNAVDDTYWTFPWGYGGVDSIVLKGSTSETLHPARYGG